MKTIDEAYRAGFAAAIAKAAGVADGEEAAMMRVAVVHRPPFLGVDEEVADMHEQGAYVARDLAVRIRAIPSPDGAPRAPEPKRRIPRRRG